MPVSGTDEELDVIVALVEALKRKRVFCHSERSEESRIIL
jgi:hypothetical protein